jgi:hypothetical protein
MEPIGIAITSRRAICGVRRRSILGRAVCRSPASLVFLLTVLKPHVAGALASWVFGSACALPILDVGGTAVQCRARGLGQGRRGAPALARAIGKVDGLGVVRRHRVKVEDWVWLVVGGGGCAVETDAGRRLGLESTTGWAVADGEVFRGLVSSSRTEV